MGKIIVQIEQMKKAYIDEILRRKKDFDALAIYGAGKYGRDLLKILRNNKIDVDYFCVTSKEYNLNYVEGIPVINLDELCDLEKECLVLVSVKIPINKKIVKNLQNKGISSYIDVPKYFDEMLDDCFSRPILEITPRAGCSVHCRFCPQDLFLGKYYNKNRNTEMTFDIFKECIDKTPENLMIDFSGFVEPFLAKDAIKMMQYAHSIGRDIRLYTTLVGLSVEDFEKIKDIPFKRVVLHLPDKNGYANIPMTEEYFDLLKTVVETSKPDGTPFVDMANCQSEPHPKTVEIIDRRVLISWNLIDRAGNLSGDNLRSSDRKQGQLYCGRAEKLDHNVLLPNGDVLLCCMDFGMECVLGNLVENSYSEIVEGKAMQKILYQLYDDSVRSLCRRCTEAKALENRGCDYGGQ